MTEPRVFLQEAEVTLQEVVNVLLIGIHGRKGLVLGRGDAVEGNLTLCCFQDGVEEGWSRLLDEGCWEDRFGAIRRVLRMHLSRLFPFPKYHVQGQEVDEWVGPGGWAGGWRLAAGGWRLAYGHERMLANVGECRETLATQLAMDGNL